MEDDKEEIKIATSSEERVANLLLSSLETFDHFMSIALGLEVEQLDDISQNRVNTRRVEALIKSANALKQVIRKARPTITQVVDMNDPKNDALLLNAIRLDVDGIIRAKESAEMTRSKQDDLIFSRWVEHGNYGKEVYQLSPNFWRLVRELERLYEEVYAAILRNGLLTPRIKEAERRRKLSSL